MGKDPADLGLPATDYQPILRERSYPSDAQNAITWCWVCLAPTATDPTRTTFKIRPTAPTWPASSTARRLCKARPGRGQYCGTTTAGYYTLNNGTEATQGYLHASDEFNEHFQLFTDVLIDHDTAEYSNGPGFWATNVTNTYNDFYDPNLNDYITLQHIFSPEEAGGLNNTLNKNTTNSIRATLGAMGNMVGSWTYQADFTYTENKLTESLKTSFTAPIEAFFAPLFGPNLGPDPNGFGEPTYAPNYANFYKPLTPAEWNSFNGPINSYSRTEESLARLQVTNPSLFELPGGNAGLAVVLDGGAQGWNYAPDPDFFNGGAYLYTSVAGSGHRSRYSGTSEIRLPVVKMLTLDLSGRYDDYKVLGENVDKFTYNLGIEFRPFQMLMLRGRYGTAFKAPTLADEFQGPSGFFEFVTDYYRCAQAGFTGNNIGNCPYSGNQQVFGTTQGNPALKPITAKVYDLGFALTPVDRLLITSDFISWRISNEITVQPSDQLLKQESACLLGQLDPTSPTCVNAIANVTRDQFGALSDILTPKVNVAEENLNVFTATLDYTVSAGVAGEFVFSGSYSNVLKHNFTQFAGDTEIDLPRESFLQHGFQDQGELLDHVELAKDQRDVLCRERRPHAKLRCLYKPIGLRDAGSRTRIHLDARQLQWPLYGIAGSPGVLQCAEYVQHGAAD